MSDTFNKDSINRFIFTPKAFVRAHARNLVVRPSLHYCRIKTESGIILPAGGDDHHEKKYEIGIVESAGAEVDPKSIRPGNIVIWQVSRAWRLPNGTQKTPSLYHLMANSDSVIAVLPNPEKLVAGDIEELQQFGLTDTPELREDAALWTEKAGDTETPPASW